ncbi:MAG: class I SAM-dependent methyltransferase [Elusimicrobia bacterium]|nr:class I SAM-dependent methyltransferase [Candidatus Obscuribacterium magneticum]
MNKFWQAIRNVLILGQTRQSFLGAKWIISLLRHSPSALKRTIALHVLSLSPHYFNRELRLEYKSLSTRQFLEAEFERNRLSRQIICEQIIEPHLHDCDTVLDLGCGPGWLAKHVSRKAMKMYACDISEGVLECAKVLNSAHNLTYLKSDENLNIAVADNSLDLVYSFAVIQHVTDKVFGQILDSVYIKLKPGGTCLFHIVLDDAPGWRTESEWKADPSIYGKMKWRWGLNCFCRNRDSVIKLVLGKNFADPQVFNMSELAHQLCDDIVNQHLLVFKKPVQDGIPKQIHS